jgi:hypothetical protein
VIRQPESQVSSRFRPLGPGFRPQRKQTEERGMEKPEKKDWYDLTPNRGLFLRSRLNQVRSRYRISASLAKTPWLAPPPCRFRPAPIERRSVSIFLMHFSAGITKSRRWPLAISRNCTPYDFSVRRIVPLSLQCETGVITDLHRKSGRICRFALACTARVGRRGGIVEVGHRGRRCRSIRWQSGFLKSAQRLPLHCS